MVLHEDYTTAVERILEMHAPQNGLSCAASANASVSGATVGAILDGLLDEATSSPQHKWTEVWVRIG